MPVLAVLAVVASWCTSPDARWIAHALDRASLPGRGCTGSAFVVDLGRGDDLYVWAFRARRSGFEPDMKARLVAGVPVHLNRLRASWGSGRRLIWIEAGP